MRGTGGAQAWRLVRLTGWAAGQPCRHCGLTHEYLTRPRHGGGCQPVLLPPGFVHAVGAGVDVEVFRAGPDEPLAHERDESRYRRLARQVAARGIRCERCGDRFEDLDAYAEHRC